MHKAKRMTASPMTCLMCGRGNTPDDPDTMDEFWVLDTERDIDWGDTAYICKYCCEQIGVYAGLVGMQDLEETQALVKVQSKKIHDLEAKLASRDRRLQTIARGEQAEQTTIKEQRRQERQKGVDELRARARRRAKPKAKAKVSDDD